MSIANHVLITYRAELLARKQIVYHGHVFMVVDDWYLTTGKHVYEIWDNMSLRHYTIFTDTENEN